MRVLFVSGIDGFCHRYEVLHRARQVARLGGTATVRHFQDPRLAADLESHDLLFVYRVPATAAVVELIDAARGRGCAVVGCIDDLIFIPDAGLFPDLATQSLPERDLWMDGVRRYRATLERCDAVVLSTEPLCAEAEAVGLRALLHRNSMSDPELRLGRAAAPLLAGDRRSKDEVRLGYFCGTPTHDRDFAVIAPVLARLLREDARVRLRLVGPLDPGPEIAALGERVERLPLVPWWRLPAEVAACDVSLAPLDLTRFGASKGEIKYLEAAAVGIPTVASPAPAYRHAISDGDNGALAATADQWWAALTRLIADPAQRSRLGAAAREDVGARFAETARARELGALLDAVARQRGERSARRGVPAFRDGTDRDLPAARVALEPDACPGAVVDREPVPERESPSLLSGGTIAQDFRPISADLLRIDVHVITYGRAVPGTLEIALRDEDGTVIDRTRLPAREAPDRAWLALELPAPLPVRGRRLSLCLTLVDGDPEIGLGFGLSASVVDGVVARLDGRPLAGALALRAFSSWSAAGDAGTDR